MRTFPLLSLACMLSLLTACATTVRVAPGQGPGAVLPASWRVLATSGDAAFSVRTGSMRGVYGCAVAYEVYAPAESRTDITVVLGHGFMRDLGHMRGWARLWASYGIPTVILTFCNASFAAGHHDRNAEDMIALAQALHAAKVVYAGFSAGGLAALIAASLDPHAVGYLGLDPVDSGGMGAPAAAVLAVPGLFLEGDPTTCNAQGNMAGLVPRRAGVAAVRVPHSVHCSFEDPSDSACASLCGSVEPEDARRDVTDTIHVLATAWILHAGGMDELSRPILQSLWGAGEAGAAMSGSEWDRRAVVLQSP